MANEQTLKQTLNAWQIFFIVITVVIGTGCFTDFGVVARTAGPAGLILAVFIVGGIAICAMEGLSEMCQLFPTVNPIVELVHEFVDEDLALCVGTAYWVANSSVFVLQIVRAASYIDFYVDATQGGWLAARISLFYVNVYGAVILINCANVRVFGTVETIGGIFKTMMILVIVCMVFETVGINRSAHVFTEGIFPTLYGSSTPGSAICLAIETIAFSFLGMEAFAVTAFEAKDSISLRIPSKIIAYSVFWCYLILAIATSMCLDWKTAPQPLDLAQQYFTYESGGQPGTASSTISALIIAALNADQLSLAQAMNAIYIFCAISAANSTLYVSSRMLYGIAHVNTYRKKDWINSLAHVRENGVPRLAVLVSALLFFWVPYTQIKTNVSTNHLSSWFFISSSICIFFMWTSLCVAYIRYWFAFRLHKNGILQDLERRRFNRWSSEKGFSTFLDRIQPIPAFIGLIGSFLVVWVFSSAMFWGREDITGQQFMLYYSMPLLLPLALFSRKLYVWIRDRKSADNSIKHRFRRWWKKFEDEEQILQTIENLYFLKPNQQPYSHELQTVQTG